MGLQDRLANLATPSSDEVALSLDAYASAFENLHMDETARLLGHT